MKEKEKKLYNAPVFYYGDRVVVDVNLEDKYEDDMAITAQFYDGECGTVIDCQQYSGDDCPTYCIQLDENLGTPYSDTNGKCIWLKELYLSEDYEDVFGDIEDGCDEECNKEDNCKGFMPTRKQIRDGLRSAALEEVLYGDATQKAIGKEFIHILSEAEAYENLNNEE